MYITRNISYCLYILSENVNQLCSVITLPGFPQDQGKLEKNNGPGKVSEFYFRPIIREKSGIFYLFLGQESGDFFSRMAHKHIVNFGH